MLVQLAAGIRIAIGLVFLLSTATKLRHPKDFASGVARYEILPARLSYAFAAGVILAEGGLALMHLSAWELALASQIGVLLMTIFAIGVGVNLIRGRKLKCHCFGSAEPISMRSLIRVLLVMSGELFLMRNAGLANLGMPVLAFFWAGIMLWASVWVLDAHTIYHLFWHVIRNES
jgi:hypothetical protein